MSLLARFSAQVIRPAIQRNGVLQSRLLHTTPAVRFAGGPDAATATYIDVGTVEERVMGARTGSALWGVQGARLSPFGLFLPAFMQSPVEHSAILPIHRRFQTLVLEPSFPC